MNTGIARWLALGVATWVLIGASVATATEPRFNYQLKRNPSCEVPFPHDALRAAPAGFRGEALVLITFNVEGRFRSASLMRSSGNEQLDDAALRAAVGARCEPLADLRDRSLDNALIGIPFSFTFDNSHLHPAEAMPVR